MDSAHFQHIGGTDKTNENTDSTFRNLPQIPASSILMILSRLVASSWNFVSVYASLRNENIV